MKTDISHGAISELLPWYANGTLEAGERRSVEQHLEQCTDCREELAFLQEVDATASEMVASMPSVPDGLADTFARIETYEQTRTSGAGGLLARFVDLLRPAPVRWALAAQMAVIFALGGLLLFRAPAPDYVTLSGSTGASDGVRLTVMFEPEATEGTIREALQDIDGTFVSGPSASGVYIVQIPVASDDEAAVDAAIETLQFSSVVRFVEREP